MSYTTSRRHRPISGRHPVGRHNGARPSRQLKEAIPISRFIKVAQPMELASYSAQHTFQSLALEPLLERNIQARGLITPSPIQDQAIPLGLQGKDILGIANTGTGKTLAFAIPVLQKVMRDKGAKALIMAPTRELAKQIEDECVSVGRGGPFRGALLIGGSPIGPQVRDLSYNPNVVVGTPGRIKDHMRQGKLDLSTFTIIVLDEVDMMLDMGFINDVRAILSQLPAQRQSFFFSATLDRRVADLVQTFSKDTTTISVKTGETTDNVEQNIVSYGSKEQKLEKLHAILNDSRVAKALVFDDTKHSVERLHKALQARGLSTDSLHGGRSQNQRQRALNRFKANEVSVLVATDVAARGIDVHGVTHVINYSTPKTYTDYVHRIGRAGRAGRTGHALTFVENGSLR
jgi:superfamily II DNA/RNA helicase